MIWIADSTGATEVDITFKLATGITEDGEGGVPSGTTDIVVPVRLVQIISGTDLRIVENSFPGTESYEYAFWCWVNDPTDYKFPSTIRRQKTPVGTCTLPELGSGQIRISLGLVNPAAAEIGEKCVAIWTQSND